MNSTMGINAYNVPMQSITNVNNLDFNNKYYSPFDYKQFQIKSSNWGGGRKKNQNIELIMKKMYKTYCENKASILNTKKNKTKKGGVADFNVRTEDMKITNGLAYNNAVFEITPPYVESAYPQSPFSNI